MCLKMLLLLSFFIVSGSAMFAETDCDDQTNPIGQCECEGQFFIDGACNVGFWCNGTDNGGCLKTCENGTLLMPDFSQNTWKCMDADEAATCPGEFKVECEDIGSNFKVDDCDCEGQVLISSDCRETFLCLLSFPNGGFGLRCNENEIVNINFADGGWECVPDDGGCPGLGGVKIGCHESNPTPGPNVRCPNSTFSTGNPIGTCVCDKQIWVNPDCSKGYYCFDTTGEGCFIECEPGTFITTNFTANQWECKAKEDIDGEPCQLNGFDICPSNETVSTVAPPDEITGNPLGKCRCDDELWVSEGCSYAFHCNSSHPDGGHYIACPKGEIVQVDFDQRTWFCSNNTSECPGGPVLGVGCPVPLCTYSNNPFGECTCDEQLFINSDCTQGFYCSSNIPDPYIYDGCIKKCLDNQILIPNFATKGWECVDNFNNEHSCPGKYKLECPENDLGNKFNKSMCECQGQLLISGDCKHGFHCNSFLTNGGSSYDCKDDEILHVDVKNSVVKCIPDDGNCPNLGGVKLGCDDNSPSPTPPPDFCIWEENSLGDCECPGQIFISSDCQKSFYCHTYPQQGSDGCLLECPAGKRVQLDVSTKTWECVPMEEDFVCPGKFNLDCGSNVDINCGCANEVWVDEDCTQAFFCEEERLDGFNQGTLGTCPNGSIVDIQFHFPIQFQCTEEVDKCPGSFHFGCDGAWANLTTPSPNTTTSVPETTTSSGRKEQSFFYFNMLFYSWYMLLTNM